MGGDDVALVPAKPAATAGQPNPQDAVRRDYELALQAGDRDGWEAFLQAYPDGFYANLARVQLKKIAAEEVRVAAEQKAKLAEQEKARLASERAQKAEQDKAAAAAKAAEETRVAAEKQKQVEQARAEAAEQQRKTAEAAAAKAFAEKQAAEKAAAEAAARQAADRQAADAASKKVAALSPAPSSSPAPDDLAKSVQLELRRVGCMTGSADSEWGQTAQRSLALFNKYAGTKFDAKLASTGALDELKANRVASARSSAITASRRTGINALGSPAAPVIASTTTMNVRRCRRKSRWRRATIPGSGIATANRSKLRQQIRRPGRQAKSFATRRAVARFGPVADW